MYETCNVQYTMIYKIFNKKHLHKIITQFAIKVRIKDIIFINGNLGVGKTTFVKSLVKELKGKIKEVISPTYNFVHTYKTKTVTVRHFDLYRINSAKELLNGNLKSILEKGVSIFEWGTVIENIIKRNIIKINLSFTQYKGIRLIEILWE